MQCPGGRALDPLCLCLGWMDRWVEGKEGIRAGGRKERSKQTQLKSESTLLTHSKIAWCCGHFPSVPLNVPGKLNFK